MWNTYHARGLNNVVHLPDLFCVRVGLYDKIQHFVLDDMLWRNQADPDPRYKNVRRFGGHANDGSYFEIELCYGDFHFRIECASQGDAFVMEVTPAESRDDLSFIVSPLLLWQRQGSTGVHDTTLTAETPEGRYRVEIEGRRDTDACIYTEVQGVAMQVAKPLRLLCNLPAAGADALMAEKREAFLAGADNSGGWLADAGPAMQKAMIWNTIYDPIKDRVCVPVSRAWCCQNGKSFGSYVLFDWDTYFSALMGGTYSEEVANQQVRAIFAEMTTSGMIPNFGSQRGGSPDRSQPPVGAYCLLKLYRQFGDKSLLETFYPQLKRWNAWWMPHRDGNGDGLLEWGSDPIPDGIAKGYYDEGNTHLCAMYESGLDNSPMYDDVPFNTGTHTLELADAGLNALYAMDCEALAQIAGILGRQEDAAALLAEYERVKAQMNAEMYDPELGMYCNLHWDGRKDTRFSPTNFYPLLAGIPSAEQARAMVEKHLLNPDEFWGDYVIPSISRAEPAFADQDYWRGRIWGPMNYLVYEGLKRCGDHDTAAAFAQRGYALFRKEWEEESHIHENYNAITGDGDDKFNADPFYTWGALLAYIPVCEYLYIKPEGGLRLGNKTLPGASFSGLPMADARYSVDTRNGLEVQRDNRPFLRSGGLLLPHLEVAGGIAQLELEDPAQTLEVSPQPDIHHLRVTAGGTCLYDGPLDAPLCLPL